MPHIVSNKIKKISSNIFFTLMLIMGCANITGCTPRYAAAFDKAVTFRDYQMYKSDITFWRFEDGVRSNPSTYTLKIQDRNKDIFYIMDYGSYSYLGGVRVDHFDEDLKPYREFLKWAVKPADERNRTAQALSDSELFKNYDFTVYTEKETQEPLLIIRRDPGFYIPTKIYAMTKREVIKLLLQSAEIKFKNEHGIKNETDFDRIGL
ncbi:hypothetical protein AAH450_13920 [Erwinia sp. P7711]|uniref:hypothetical protein n=1 Tax=Erwinia sp. P7711 TaxID=3141451 RepID=UPI0031914007